LPDGRLTLWPSAHLLEAEEAVTAAEILARYLPPQLAEPDHPPPRRRCELDLPRSQEDLPAGPLVHPAARSDLAEVCPAPPDPAWLSELKAQWTQDRYGNAEPLAGQRSYLPFRCY